MTAYLSGGMEYAENYGADWRSGIEEWLKESLAHESFNPVRASEVFLSTEHPGLDFRLSKQEDLTIHRKVAREIVNLDSREIILRSNYLICFYDESAQRGAGTKGELTVAALFGKPVYLVLGMPVSKIPSWVIGCADDIFSDFDSLKKFLLGRFRK